MVEKTETPMQILLHDARRISGYGLLVKVYDRNPRLLLDSGASGVIINRRAAEKAGLKHISSVHFNGIGDSASTMPSLPQPTQFVPVSLNSTIV